MGTERSGIDIKWASELKVQHPAEQSIEEDNDQNLLCIALSYLMGIGSGLSFIVFLLERFYNYYLENSILDPFRT